MGYSDNVDVLSTCNVLILLPGPSQFDILTRATVTVWSKSNLHQLLLSPGAVRLQLRLVTTSPLEKPSTARDAKLQPYAVDDWVATPYGAMLTWLVSETKSR